MTIVNGRTYRFTNVYHEGYGLNIYGTSANDIKGGQNVCLYPASASDKMQQWKTEERDDNTYRLHTVMTGRTNYVLDCSDGSISTSYKNNAHMCLETGTTDVDCAVEFEYVGTNRVRIHLGQKGLCLTATTVADNDAELSNNISTSAALRGGSAGRGNVYWASPASEGSMTWKKQCWYVIDVEGESEPGQEPKMTLAQLQKKFPNGKYWNHVGMSSNNQNGYTDSPCPTHGEDNDNLSTCNCYVLNGVEKAWQCQGFVMKCGYDAYGTDPYNWTTFTNSNAMDNLKPGDIVRFYTTNDEHSIFVTAVSGDTVTYGDCNADLHCGIRWGATTTKTYLRKTGVFKKIFSAPFALK